MNESVRLGHIAGVRIGLNWSVVVIVVLLALGLAGARFPVEFPGRSTTAYVVAGLVAAIVFLLSLLAHEISHAVVARRNQLEVEGITLWLFGGVAKLRGEARDPGAELRIAGIGPLTSAIIGAAFLLAAWIGGLAGPDNLVLGVLRWLGAINLVLAVFNMVPAAPLDGGRVLRAFLWRRRGDRLSASITAAQAGRVFGFALVGLGLLEIALTAGFGGLWFVLLGWFLITAARAEEEHARMRGALADVRVREVMSANPLTVPGSVSIEDFLEQYVLRNRFSAFPVTQDGGRPSLMTLRRVKQVPREAHARTSVRDVACPPEEVATARPDEPLADLLPRLSQCAEGRALVLEDGRVVGLVSPSDIARRLEVTDLRDPRETSHI